MKRLRHDVGQRGAVAVLVALIIIVLIGAAGIALDLGRLFVAKAELQNAVDACALAAARELATPSTSAVLTRAENAGMTVGNKHRADFQDSPVQFVREKDVTFSSTLNGTYVTKESVPANVNVRFVRCTRVVPGFLPWFMHLLGAGSQTVGATAVAWAQPSSHPTCPIPLGMCSKVKSPDTCATGLPDATTGLCIGKWYNGKFGNKSNINGNFNWLDFSGGGGGSPEVQKGLEGCIELDKPIGVGDLVDAKAGDLGEAAGTSWNTRFGIYKKGGGAPSAADGAVPDTTGYAFTTSNSAGFNVLADYQSMQRTNEPFQGNEAAGWTKPDIVQMPPYSSSTKEEHARGETDRRLIAMPLVDCSTWGPGHKAEVKGWACALMLTPYRSPDLDIALEYRGVAGEPGVPCGTYGQPGGTGPRVPTLVQ